MKRLPKGNLRRHKWPRFLRGPDPKLLEELYVPALREAVRYDRCCSYFSSSVLSAAARGFAGLIERLIALGAKAPRPAARLVVNEELAAEDVQAMIESGDTTALEEALRKRFKEPRDFLEKQRLAMLGWLVKAGFLEVRVGVMRFGEGVVHAKFGIVTDERGNAIVFNGSGNESAAGLRANYERLEISGSWADKERYEEYRQEFEQLWNDTHPDVHTVSLPEAVRLKLIKFAPAEPPTMEPSNARSRQRAGMLWQFLTEAPYLPDGVGAAACDATALVDLWPHQRRVVEEVSSAWPDGRLLCDEVGMGKTIEAILVLRRLLAGRGVRRALLLVPAGLTKQWQAELREKGGLIVPRLEGVNTLVWPEDRTEKVAGLSEALNQNVLVMSRETARTENNRQLLLAAEPWDLVLLDEAHAARRAKQVEGEFNVGTLLLDLLRQLQLRGKTRGFLLLSATPMQTQPWEPWDLLSVLGEGGAWLAEFGPVREYYRALAALQRGLCDPATARRAATLICADPEFSPPPVPTAKAGDVDSIARLIAFPPPAQREQVARWLRQGSPLTRRMHRNTRETLRRYYEMGLLNEPPPVRRVNDIRFDFMDPAERDVYNAVTRYIDRRFRELEAEKPGKGFVMTVYRRRAASSPLALQRSLERRRDALKRMAEEWACDTQLSERDVPELLDEDDLGGVEVRGRISLALPQDPQATRRELLEVNRLLDQLKAVAGRDSKRDRFFEVLKQVTDDGRAVLVFTGYTDTQDYLREHLEGHYGGALGCYNGDGGRVLENGLWKTVTKDVITQRLREGRLRVLICTDAASEGLNLQAAGAVINYDLPWNPMRVEQRIGRIDRIGQKYREVLVVNLFLKNSVDDQVYHALRHRCGLFEHFVGPMQPVLAHAQRMLLNHEPVDLAALDATASEMARDPLAHEIYLESDPVSSPGAPAALTREDLIQAINELPTTLELTVRANQPRDLLEIKGLRMGTIRIATSTEALERDCALRPLSPFDPALKQIRDSLQRPGERLPLIIGSAQQSAFRASVAVWIGQDGNFTPIKSLSELKEKLASWDGSYPQPAVWHQAKKQAQEQAEQHVRKMAEQAAQRHARSIEKQKQAAALRLQRELGRFLICLSPTLTNLNKTLHEQISRDSASSARLKKCLEQLGGYPTWDKTMSDELARFAMNLTDNERKGRLIGRELDAALNDPRWLAARCKGEHSASHF
ncbi:MAG: helicase-related protein [Verrucomicrobiae bacterium]|nr:helicase-related protein [Verrucomicrobiae bacterium]